MRGHPDKKTIIKALLSENESNSDVLLHVSECEKCRSRALSIRAVLESSDNTTITASDNLENRIVQSFRRIKDEDARGRVNFLLNKQLFKPAFAFAALFFIALSSFIIFKSQNGGVPVAVSNAKGIVTINGENAERGAELTTGSEIKTGNQSIAEITFDNQFRIELAKDTSLSVEKTMFNKSQNKLIFSFSLKKGKIYSEFYHNSQQMEYSFKTPDAVIHSIGTKFLLSVSEGKTELFLTEGSVKIQSTVSGEEMLSTEGKKFIIAGKIISWELFSSEKTVFDLIKTNRKMDNKNLKDNYYQKITAKQKTEYKIENEKKKINSPYLSDPEVNQRGRDSLFPGPRRRHRPPTPHPPHHRPPLHPPHDRPPLR